MQQRVTSYSTVYSQIHIADNPQKLSAYNVNLVNKHCEKINNHNKNSIFELHEIWVRLQLEINIYNYQKGTSCK
mgnify:CR=1 FL=1